MKFRGGLNRESYLTRFSLAEWCELALSEKEQHTMSRCTRCFQLHEAHQSSFPLKLVYHPTPALAIDRAQLQRQGAKVFATNAVAELNRAFGSEVNRSFTDTLLTVKSLGFDRRKTSNERRQEKRKLHREVKQQVTEHFAATAAITMLTEGDSKREYHRKRMAQSYHTPEAPPKAKKHSPDFSKVSWDTEALEETLLNWPSETVMNWSAVARQHGIQGGNAGQIVKEFAQSRNITSIATPQRKATKRPCRRKLTGTGISIPANPPLRKIEADIQQMLASGRFSLGEECTPYKITKYTLKDGKLSPYDILVQARKVPLQQIRQRLLTKHQQFMRSTSTEVARMWHDHATILGMGFIMVTVHVMFDSSVFLTDEEYNLLHPDATLCVQSEVEQPEIHLVSLGSSSVEDQAALVGDRLSCILNLNTPVQTESGIQVSVVITITIEPGSGISFRHPKAVAS